MKFYKIWRNYSWVWGTFAVIS